MDGEAIEQVGVAVQLGVGALGEEGEEEDVVPSGRLLSVRRFVIPSSEEERQTKIDHGEERE